MPGRRKKSQSKPNNNKSKGENQRMTQNWPKHVQTFSSESVPKEVEDCCCCNTNSLAHYSMEVAHSLHLGGSSQQDLCLNRNQIWNEDNTVSENRKNNTTWHLLPFLIASAKKKLSLPSPCELSSFHSCEVYTLPKLGGYTAGFCKASVPSPYAKSGSFPLAVAHILNEEKGSGNSPPF